MKDSSRTKVRRQMTSHPEISVIIPVYNVQDHIFACIDSLLKQTFTNFEAIIVDDGSTDASSRRLVRAIAQDPRFRILRQKNHGLSAARNVALDCAKGKFITFLDGDDRYHPSFLHLMHEEIHSSDADWVACAIELTYPENTSAKHSSIHDMPDIRVLPASCDWPLNDWQQITRHFPSVWNKIYRRDFIGKLRFGTDQVFEDHAFYLSLATRTERLRYLSFPLYMHTRERNGQITGADSDQIFVQFAVLRTLIGIIETSSKPCKALARNRLASRLLFERSKAIRSPNRRKEFAKACRLFLNQNALDWHAALDPYISPAWFQEMSGHVPLTVVVTWSDPSAPVHRTLASLASQSITGFETVLVISPEIPIELAQRLLRCIGIPHSLLVNCSESASKALEDSGFEISAGLLRTTVNAGTEMHFNHMEHLVNTATPNIQKCNSLPIATDSDLFEKAARQLSMLPTKHKFRSGFSNHNDLSLTHATASKGTPSVNTGVQTEVENPLPEHSMHESEPWQTHSPGPASSTFR